MARIEWVEQRLQNWALWHHRSGSGALGYATQSSFLAVAVDGSRYREARIPVDEVEAAITEEAVQALRPERAHLYETLVLFYVSGRGIGGTAEAMRRAVSTVHANLGHADAVLSVWFADRKRRKEVEARALREQLHATRSPRLAGVELPNPPKKRRTMTTRSFTS